MFETWSELYSNSANLRTLVLFMHTGGLLLGGGCAVAADRMTLKATPGDARQLADVAGVHKVVIAGLVLMAVSGVGMLFNNFETLSVSRYFWAKMVGVGLLGLNGLRLTRAEKAASAGRDGAWATLRQASITSLILWFVITLLGAYLPNV